MTLPYNDIENFIFKLQLQFVLDQCFFMVHKLDNPIKMKKNYEIK